MVSLPALPLRKSLRRRRDGVVEVRTDRTVDARKGIMAYRAVAVGRTGHKIHDNAAGGVAKANLRSAVADD